MEDSINKRLKKFIEAEKINGPDIYKNLGTKRQDWNNWLNGGAAIPLTKIQRIINLLPDMNARWLLTGEGAMNEFQTDESTIHEPKSEYKSCKACDAKDITIKTLNEYINTLKEMVVIKQQLIDLLKPEDPKKNDDVHCD